MNFAPTHWGLSWLAGSLSILSPCVFPLLPLVLGGLTPGNRLGPLAMDLAVMSGADKWLEARILPFLPPRWLQLMALF